MTLEKLDKDGFCLDPKPAKSVDDHRMRDERAWYYEQKEGIVVVFSECGQALIPRRQLLRWARIAGSI